MSKLVILLSLGLIGQKLPGLSDLLELLLGSRLLVHIGMVLLGQLVVDLFDVGQLGVFVNTKDLVRVQGSC